MSVLTQVGRTIVMATAVSMLTTPVFAGNGNGGGRGGSNVTLTAAVTAEVDYNEETHLVFMREEEKLARDVYYTLGALYPNATVFSNIDDSEQQHTTTVKDKLDKYGIEDPNPDTGVFENIGIFTGVDYGWYFTEKYTYLVGLGANSEFDALYVGAFIEELDMLDIVECPKVIVDTDNGINDPSECGMDYTDNADIQKMYESLLDGSKNHLRAYVGNIEAVTGECSYTAQVLTKEEVDAILGRVCP